jgi:hypothetical protein
VEKVSQNGMKEFQGVLREIMTVSKRDLRQLLADDKRQKVGKPKRGPKAKTSASAPVASRQN